LRIYEAEVKHSSSPGNPTQNIAFMSSSNTDSTTDSVSAATSVSAVCAQLHVSSHPNIDSLSNVVIFTFFASQPTSPQIDNEDLKQIDSYQAKKEPANFALMAIPSSSSAFDNEVKSCTKACSKAYDELHSQYYKLTIDFRKSQFDVLSYQAALESVEARLVLYKQNESIFQENINMPKNEVQARDSVLVSLKQKLNQTEIKRDDLKLKFDKFQLSSQSLTKLLANQTNSKHRLGYHSESDSESLSQSSLSDRSQPSGEYHDVSPPITGNFMPPKPDLVFYTALIAVETTHSAFTVHPSSAKPAQDISHATRPMAPIIEDWVSDSEDESEPNDPQSALSFVQTSEHAKISGHSVLPVEESILETTPNSTSSKTKVITKSKPVSVTAARPGNPQHALKDKGVIDSGCSRHMTGNISYLSDFQELNGGYVAFGGNSKCGKITGKGKIKTDLKLPDENQVLLRVPRENNMYNVNLKDIAEACKFQNINKLVKGNLVRRLPTKVFENQNNCVACMKGKQHRASCKTKPVSFVTQPFFRLYMNLFGPTFVKSLSKKCYCLVITDDISRFTWVFFLTTKDETSSILKNLVNGLENQLSLKVKVIRSNNGTEFKNSDLNQFCEIKGIKREFSVPGTPQQNSIAERKNRTLIEDARTMLADFILPISFWAEAVNTVCYVQNRVLVTKPQNKTLYDLLHGRPPSIGFMRPFGCLVTILNTLDSLGKFEGKVDEGFLVGYSVNSKAFRVFNSQTRIVQETLHVNFLENKANITGIGPTWLFDIDSLTRTMNYQPVTAGNQSNPSAGFQEEFDARKTREEATQQYILFPVWSTGSSNPQNTEGDATFDGNEHSAEHRESTVNLSPRSSALSGEQDDITKKRDKGKSHVDYFTGNRDFNEDFEDYSEDSNAFPSHDMLEIKDIVYSNNENAGAEADFNNLETSITVSPIPTTRIHNAHPISQIIEEHKRVHQDLKDPSSIEAMQEELLQLKMQKVWILVDLPHRKGAIGIDYEEVFSPVARIEAIRLFLAYASFMGFMMYQMDVKSTFLYGTIEEEVYVYQPLRFEDPDHPDKVYKVVKALYRLHQAPRAWYETLATYLLENGFHRGKIDQTLFIKKQKGDILLVQIYVDDIIFEDGIFINQDKYVVEILKKFGLTKGKSASIPIDTEKPLLKDPDGEDVDVHIYRSMIGSLIYLTSSRPDIMFAVCACARFQVTPKVSHLLAVKRIFRYLKGKPNLGLWYPKDSPFDLVAYSESDYAGASLDRKSTTGGCQFLGTRLISWQCKKQTVVATSSTEADYVASASCCAQVLWIQNQMQDYGD
nr:hypothetical protein [Tanacetum cinerariifolium]